MNKAKRSLVRNTKGGYALFLPDQISTERPHALSITELQLRNKMDVTGMYRNKFI